MKKIRSLHPWDVTPQEAISIQRELREYVLCEDAMGEVKTVAGVDVGFTQNGKITRAALVVLGFPDFQPLEDSIAQIPTTFPYIPGLLSFREIPAILSALEQLSITPDLLLCDGQGLAHPRRFGLACHLGVLTDIPSIGVGKTRLTGTYDDVAEERGAWEQLTDGSEIIGAVLRTRTGVKPVFVSIGHRISLETAIDMVLKCAPKYRLPEPIRQAHKLASQK